jgi:nitroreductase
MELFEAISRRHSYRGRYAARTVPREDLGRIVQAGIQAPSGYNGQSTTFVVVDDAATLAAISEIVPGELIAQAPAVIVCVLNSQATPEKEHNFAAEDYAAAVENILLAVTALGYVSVWMDGVLRREGRAQRIAQILGVPAHLVVRAILPVGVAAEERTQREKRPFAERAWFNRYGGP